jgi:uncharacterized protein YqgC (DUF456 family)
LEIHDFLAGVLVLAGLVGIVVPVLPGLLLQIGAIAFWAFEESSFVGWVVLVLAIVLAIAASVIKFVFPGKRLKEAQVPGWLVLVAVSVAIVGLFVIPVVGAPIGFVLTIYLFERARHGGERAWPSTKSALRAVLQSIGIELSGGFLIAVVFFFGVFLT